MRDSKVGFRMGWVPSDKMGEATGVFRVTASPGSVLHGEEQKSLRPFPFLQVRDERHFLKARGPDEPWAFFQLWVTLALTG